METTSTDTRISHIKLNAILSALSILLDNSLISYTASEQVSLYCRKTILDDENITKDNLTSFIRLFQKNSTRCEDEDFLKYFLEFLGDKQMNFLEFIASKAG